MPSIENNFENNILELISLGSSSDNSYSRFDERMGHYIRMAVFDEDGNLIRQYYSNRKWIDSSRNLHGETVYFNSSYLIYDNPSLTGTSIDIYDSNGDLNIQLPIYRDGNGKVFIKPNDTLAADSDIDYQTGNYRLKFDFLDDVFNHFLNSTPNYTCQLPPRCSEGFWNGTNQTENDCLWNSGICYNDSGAATGYETFQDCCVGAGGDAIWDDETGCNFGSTSYTWDSSLEWIDFYVSEYLNTDYGGDPIATQDACDSTCEAQTNGRTCFEYTQYHPSDLIYPYPRFYLREISTSRHEVRLLGRQGDNYNLYFDDNFQDIFDGVLSSGGIDRNNYLYNFVLLLPDSVNIPITNYEFDSISLDTNSLVIKLHDTIPIDVNAPSNVSVNVAQEIYYTQYENIFYISETLDDVSYKKLTPDASAISNYGDPGDTLQSFNDLIYSSSLNSGQQQQILTSIFSGSDQVLNIDYSEFRNHTFFGSAELKFRNFFSKIQSIEDKIGEISSSLNGVNGFVTESSVSSRRKILFDEINDVVSNFTSYEKWMYYDTFTTSSYPNAGVDYAFNPPISGSYSGSNYSELSDDASVINDYYGMGTTYKISTAGDDIVISGSFNSGSGDVHHFWYTGSDTNWDISENSASFKNILSNKELIQISGGIGTEVDLTVDPPTSTGFSQFSDNTSYVVKFNVNSFITSGSLTFQFGGYDAAGGQTQLPPRLKIPIFQTGDYYGNIRVPDEVDNDQWGHSGKFVPDPYNYLTIISDTSTNYECSDNAAVTQEECVWEQGTCKDNASSNTSDSTAEDCVDSAGGDATYDSTDGPNFGTTGWTWTSTYTWQLTRFVGDFDNLSIVESVDTDGRADIFTDKYRVEQAPFYYYNGPVYLTFLANWPVLPTLENYNASQSATNFGDPIPANAWNGYFSQSDDISHASKGFGRYVLAASQSYWRYPDDSTVQGNILDVTTATDSDASEILSGSHITGSYGMHTLDGNSFYDGLYAHGSQSILPSGELFRVYHATSSATMAPISSSYIMDVRVFKEDQLWSGSLSDTLMFTNLYSTSSTYVQNWYTEQLYSASEYDYNNIYSMYNNLPSFVRDDDGDEKVMKKFLGVIGENYDLLKNHIDNYLNINSRNYDKSSEIPHGLLKIIGENFGWKFINNNSTKNLLEYYIGSDSTFSYENLTNSVWSNILNNLVYIYKTKGTINSVRALMSCFGVPPEIVTVDEGGAVVQSQTNPQIDFRSSSGLRSTLGNIAFREQRSYLQLLNFNENNNSFKVDWSTYKTGVPDYGAVELVFSTFQNRNVDVLLKSSGSGSDELWTLKLYNDGVWDSEHTNPWDSGSTSFAWDSGSNSDVSASIRFEINNTSNGSGSISDGFYIESDPFPIKSFTNKSIWSVLVQRSSPAPTASYELFVANRFKDRLMYSWTGSATSYDTNVNNNFTSTGSLYSSGSNLVVGESFTGSITELRTWNSHLSESKFFQHVFHQESVVGNESGSFQDVISRYNFKGRWPHILPSSESYIRDIGSRISGSFDKQLGSGFQNPSFRKQRVRFYKFNPRAIDLGFVNTNKITISKTPTFLRHELSPFNKNIERSSLVDSQNEDMRYRSDDIKISISPTTAVNDVLSNGVTDQYLGNLIGNPKEELDSEYGDLDKFREKVLKQFNQGLVDYNIFNRKYSKLIPKDLWDIVDEITPSKVNVSKGIEISNPFLWRNKHAGIGNTVSSGDISKSTKVVIEDEVNLSNTNILNPTSNLDSNLLDVGIDDSLLLETPIGTTDSVTTDDQIDGSTVEFYVGEDVILEDEINPSTDTIDVYQSENILSEEIGIDSTSTDTHSNEVYSYSDEFEEEMSSDSISTYGSEIVVDDMQPVSGESTNVNSSTIENTQPDVSSNTSISADTTLDTEVNSNVGGESVTTPDGALDIEIRDDISGESTNIPTTDIENIATDSRVDGSSFTTPDGSLDIEIQDDISAENNNINTADIENPVLDTQVDGESISISEGALDTEVVDNVSAKNNNINTADIENPVSDSNIDSSQLTTPDGTLDTEIRDDISSNTLSTSESTVDLEIDDISANTNDSLESTVDDVVNKELSSNSVNMSNGSIEDIVNRNLDSSNLNINSSTVDKIVDSDIDGNTITTNSSELDTEISDTIDSNSITVAEMPSEDSINPNNIYNASSNFITPVGYYKLKKQNEDGDKTELGNADIKEAVFTEFDYTKFENPANTDYRVNNPVTGDYDGKGRRINTEMVTYVIGDVERINLFGANKKKYKLTDLFTGIKEDYGRYIEKEFDISNPEFFRNRTIHRINNSNQRIGRTTQIFIYQVWADAFVQWGDTENTFRWNDDFGTISYPPNHFINAGSTLDDMPVYEATINYGDENTPQDPMGMVDTGSAVIVHEVQSSGTGRGNVLKVSKN